MSKPTLANLTKQLENAQERANRMRGRGWGLGGNLSARTHHSNLIARTRQIQAQINARRAANAARNAAVARRRNRLARAVIQKWHQRAHRPSNVRNVGGIAFLRSAVKTAVGDDVLRRLRRQLLELRELRPANNSRRMRNIFNDMSKRWNSANNELAAANVMNAAQKIMNRAGLLNLSARSPTGLHELFLQLKTLTNRGNVAGVNRTLAKIATAPGELKMGSVESTRILNAADRLLRQRAHSR